MSYFIGMDADGSRARLKIADKHGKTIGEYSGPGNTITSTSFDDVHTEFKNLITIALREFSLDAADCAGLCIGAAGVDTDELRAQYIRIFELIGFRHSSILVFNDCEILTQIYPMQICVAVMTGMGSIIIGKDAFGRIARYSGWSCLVSDGGSAAFIVIEAIKHAIKYLDGYGDCCILTRLLREEAGIFTPYEMAAYVYKNISHKAEIGKLEPIVQKAAEEGDSTAQKILRLAADEIFEGVMTIAANVGGNADTAFKIVTCGSVLTENNIINDRFKMLVNERFPKAQIVVFNEKTLDIALSIATKKVYIQ